MNNLFKSQINIKKKNNMKKEKKEPIKKNKINSKKKMSLSKEEENRMMTEEMNDICPPGQIYRRGSMVEAYAKENGTKIEPFWRHGSCIDNKGEPGHGMKINGVEEMNEGILRDLGYGLNKNEKSRHDSILMAMKLHSPLKVLRHINLIRTLHKSDPENYEKLTADFHFIQKEYKKIKNEIEIALKKSENMHKSENNAMNHKKMNNKKMNDKKMNDNKMNYKKMNDLMKKKMINL